MEGVDRITRFTGLSRYSSRMKRFFVTGGAGFIGSCFVRLLLDEQDVLFSASQVIR
jgi:hypothetical protein